MPRWLDWMWDRPEALTAAGPRVTDAAVLAAAYRLDQARTGNYTPNNAGWQNQSWQYYDELGEFRYGVDWRAEMVSRVRLRAGKKVPGQDEPELLDDGPAAELIDKLVSGSVGGPDQLMRSFATLLGVPGEGWLIGETQDDGDEQYRVRSADEIRKGRKPGVKWEVLNDDGATGSQDTWRSLNTDALVTRVWDPHPRKFHLADSPARAARGVMKELELVNRHIQTLYLSRLASAGLLLLPDEMDIPVREEFRDKYNGLALEFMEVAKVAIQTPGSAAAAIPMVMTGAADFIEKARFLDFFTKLDEKLLEKRDSAIRRLATQMDLPAEVLLGMGDVNHWSAWQLEESGVKVHILPMVERICYGILVGYLQPRLKAAGEDDPDLMVWYDASEITMRPDRSEGAQAVYDVLELSGEALRRETGFDEGDKPDDKELERLILLKLARDPASAATALKALVGKELEPMATTPTPDEAEEPQESPEATGAQQEPPKTKNEPPPPPGRETDGLAHALRMQIDRATEEKRGMRHWITFRSFDGDVILHHPAQCSSIGTACPYGAAMVDGLPKVRPGSSGEYEVALTEGHLIIGTRRQDSPHARSRT
jgi:hypothetical protein